MIDKHMMPFRRESTLLVLQGNRRSCSMPRINQAGVSSGEKVMVGWTARY